MSEGLTQTEHSESTGGFNGGHSAGTESDPQHIFLQVQVLDQLSEAVLATGLDGSILTWNRGAARLFGYEAGEIAGRSLTLLFEEEQRAQELVRQAIVADRTELEVQVRTKTSEVRWVRMAASPFTDRRGSVVGAIFSCHEISERKRVEDSLRGSEARYRELADSLPETVFETDLTGRLIYVNRDAFVRFRCDREVFERGINAVELIAPEDRARAQENIAAALRGERFEPQEYTVERMDGTTFPCLIYSTPLFIHGRVAGLRGFLVDITEQKQGAQRLAESEERYRTLFEQANDAILLVDEDDRILNANRRASALFGYTREELLSLSAHDLQAPEVRKAKGAVRAALAMSAGEVIEGLALHSSGRRIPVEISIARLDGAGNVIVAMRDTTEQMRARKALARRAGEMAALYRTSLEINSQPDVPALLRSIVERAATLVGTGMGCLFLMQPDGETLELVVSYHFPGDLTGTRLKLGEGLSGRIARTGQPLIVEDYHHWADGAEAFAEISLGRVLGVPLRVNGRIIGVINVTDMGQPGSFSEEEVRLVSLFADQAAIAIENARLSASLQETNRQLRSALQAKDEMLQNVSHELRTPLTHIMGYVELLSGAELGPLSEEQTQALQVVERQAARLRHMVNRVLALQAVDASNLRKFKLDPATWLSGAVEPWQGRAAEAGVSLVLELAPDLPLLMADPDYLSQVTENLLDNAVKFSTAGGEVRVCAWAADGEFSLAVSDQGIGIPSDKLERVFERFYQVEGGSTRRFGGVGIGLPLCRKIVEAHGGRIWAESQGSGRGSRMRAVLPL